MFDFLSTAHKWLVAGALGCCFLAVLVRGFAMIVFEGDKRSRWQAGAQKGFLVAALVLIVVSSIPIWFGGPAR